MVGVKGSNIGGISPALVDPAQVSTGTCPWHVSAPFLTPASTPVCHNAGYAAIASVTYVLGIVLFSETVKGLVVSFWDEGRSQPQALDAGTTWPKPPPLT